MPIYGKKGSRLTAGGHSDVSKRRVCDTVEKINTEKSAEAILNK